MCCENCEVPREMNLDKVDTILYNPEKIKVNEDKSLAEVEIEAERLIEEESVKEGGETLKRYSF